MRSVLIGELFRELPAHGVACLRFNFRGSRTATELEIAPAADHFFLGRSDRVTAAAAEFVNQLTASP